MLLITICSTLGELCPGCGCEGEKVDNIVHELRMRMKGRGDTGNIQRAEEQLKQLKYLDAKVDLILEHLKITPPPKEEMERDIL